MDYISKHQDWESTVILEDDGSGFYGPEIPLRRIEEQGRTFMNEGFQLSKHKSYRESNSYIDKALDIFEGTFGEEYSELYELFRTKAMNFLAMKKYDEVFEWYQKALRQAHKNPDNRFQILTAYRDLAKVHIEKGQFDQAEWYYNKCFDVIHTEIEKYHSQLTNVLSEMGDMYVKKGDLKLALQRYYEAMGDIDNMSVKDQPIKAKILTRIAEVQRKLGDHEDSLRCARLAQELFEKSSACDDPPELASCYNLLGWDLYDEGNYSEALKFFKKAIQIEIKNFGREHAELTPSWKGMKSVFEQTGNEEEARKCKESILDAEKAKSF